MDSEILELEKQEYLNTDKHLNFIASENLPSEQVLEACSSVAMLRYSEGFAPVRNEDGTLGKSRRYYEGNDIIDKIESRCEEELLKLFNATDEYYANVQPPNGSIANMVAYRSILKKGDTVLSCKLDHGAHLTFSHPESFLGEFYNNINFGVDENGIIKYDEIEKLALQHKPTLIIAGMSNYSRIIDYKRFKEICDKVGAKLMCDISHISGLISSGLHPNPVGLADIITSTTHKIMRGPRSAFIIYKKELDKEVRKSVIPKSLGGANQAITMSKLLCFKEAQTEKYKDYCKQVLKNSKAMANEFINNGISILTNGTENHSFCLNLSSFDTTGKDVSSKLVKCGIITNCNSIPNEQKGFLKTSGVRLGTPCITSRGLNEEECIHIATLISNIIKNIDGAEKNLTQYTQQLCAKYPLSKIYPNRFEYLFGDKNDD